MSPVLELGLVTARDVCAESVVWLQAAGGCGESHCPWLVTSPLLTACLLEPSPAIAQYTLEGYVQGSPWLWVVALASRLFVGFSEVEG